MNEAELQSISSINKVDFGSRSPGNVKVNSDEQAYTTRGRAESRFPPLRDVTAVNFAPPDSLL